MAAAALAGSTSIDGNQLLDQGTAIVTKVIKVAAQLDAVTICNMSGKNVRFFSYNHSDDIYMISKSKVLIAYGNHQTVTGSGKHLKILPNDDEDYLFIVKKRKDIVYVYNGPGKISELPREQFNEMYAKE